MVAILMMSAKLATLSFVNPNKAGIFEGSLFWGGGQFDPPFLFQEELI